MPTDPHQPSPLDEIQAVLDSYCHVTDLNSAPKPQLHCHNPPTDFSQLNLSFFSPKNNHASPLHAPQTTKENKHSAIQHTASKVTTRSKLKRRKQPLQTKANPNPVPSSPQRSRKKPAQKIAKPRKFRRGNNKPEDPVSPLSPLTRPSRHGNEHTDNAVCAKNKDAKVTTSNDEGENSEFIEQMRRLTARKLEAEKRKREVARKKTMQRIDEMAAEGETEMRRVAGNTSKSISKALCGLKRLLPKNTADTVTDIQKILDSQEAGTRSILKEVEVFDNLLQAAESQLQSNRERNLQTSCAKEKQLLDAASAVSSRRQNFGKVLLTVEGTLKKTKVPR